LGIYTQHNFSDQLSIMDRALQGFETNQSETGKVLMMNEVCLSGDSKPTKAWVALVTDDYLRGTG